MHYKAGHPLAELHPVVEVLGTVPAEDGRVSYESVIQEMVSGVDPSVGDVVKSGLAQLLGEFTSVLSRNETDMGLTSIVMHKIDTADAEPARQVLRRQSKPATEAIDQMVPELLRTGLIEPSVSPWAANIVVVRKKDGSARCCIDYRQLNAVTKKDRYPLPRTDSCLDSMNGSKWFSTFDLRSAYHQVPINFPDREKTSFICHRGSFQYRTMPFGLCNAGATFQRLMDVVLNGLSLRICLAYLDDVIVFSRDLDEHLVRLRQVFERLQAAGLKVKPSKCRILQRQVSFLGHVINSEGISTDPEKIRAVAEWPEPRSIKDVRAFVGLASYYRRFVHGFAAIAAPLHQLMKKNAKFTWGEEQQEAFDRLKKALIESPVLVTPGDDLHYVLDADASDTAMGAVLSVIIDDEEHVVAYASRAFTKCQKNYCVTRRELLAVVLALKIFKQYLLGRHFTVRTDHSALQWFKRSKEPVGQPGRWLETMEEYSFDIQFRSGAKHANADALSRRPCLKQSCYCHDFESEQALLSRSTQLGVGCQLSQTFDIGLSRDEVAAQQKEDSELRTLYEAVWQERARPTWEEVALQPGKVKVLWGQWPRLRIRDGVLCRRWEAAIGDEVRWQVVMPVALRKTFVKQVHEGITGGHLGRNKTEEQVVHRAYWPGWKKDVAQVIKECAPCVQYHRGLPPRQAQLKPLLVGHPWERVSIDVTGPHPPSTKGHRFILTLVDHFSKWAEAFAIRRHTAPVVAKILVTQVFARFGCPEQILSDQGPEFESALLAELCRELHIDKVRTSPYKASTNGAVERFHRTLNAMLGKVVSEKQRDWDEWLPLVMTAYRASPHTATGHSPNKLTFGRETSMPVDIVLGRPEEDRDVAESYDSFAGDLVNKLEAAFTLVREELRVAAERRKKQYDLRVREKNFPVGTWVWYYCPRRYQKRSPKWQKMYTGPFLVVKYISPVNYVIQRSKRSLPKVVHADKLRAWMGEPLPSWLKETSVTADADDVDGTETKAKEKKKSSDLSEQAESTEESAGSSDEATVPKVRPVRTRRQPDRYTDF
jgi:transposase InsO family protein